MRTPGTWIPMATRQTRRRVHPGIWAWAPACLRRSAWSRPRLIYPASGAGQDEVSLPSYAFALGGSGDNQGCRVSARRGTPRGGPRGSVGDPKSLAGGEGRVRRTQGGGGDGGSLGKPLHAFYPARGDRPDIRDLDADHNPRTGDLEGLGGEGTVATARAKIAPEGSPRSIVLAAALSTRLPSLPQSLDGIAGATYTSRRIRPVVTI